MNGLTYEGDDISLDSNNNIIVSDSFKNISVSNGDTYLNVKTNIVFIYDNKWKYLVDLNTNKLTVVDKNNNNDVFYIGNNNIKNTQILYGKIDLIDNKSQLDDGVLYLYYETDIDED